PVHPDRPSEVPELLFARILKGNVELASGIFLYPSGDADPSRLREALQTCRYVHAVAVDVAAVADDVADIDAHTELDPLLLGHVGVAPVHTLLNLGGATQG